MRLALSLALAAVLQACANTGPGPLPPGVATDHDLRGAYRAALCAPDRLGADGCSNVLRTPVSMMKIPGTQPLLAPWHESWKDQAAMLVAED